MLNEAFRKVVHSQCGQYYTDLEPAWYLREDRAESQLQNYLTAAVLVPCSIARFSRHTLRAQECVAASRQIRESKQFSTSWLYGDYYMIK